MSRSPRAMAAMVGSESGSSVTAVPYRVPDRTKKKGILAAGVAPGSGGGGRGGVGLGVGSSLLGGGESSVAGGRASFGASPRSGHKHLARLLESSTSTIDEGGSVTVVGLPLGTWYADGGAAVASGLGLAVALELTFTCWGQMKRSLNATVFRDMCSARLQQAGLLYNNGEGDEGRAAVQLHFPEGVPRRWDMPASAPQLVLNITVRLSERLLKDDKLLLTIRTHGEVLARALGEATGVDSVTCRLATRPEDEPQWRPGMKTPGAAELLEQGEKRYVIYQRGIEADPYAAVESDWMQG